MTPRAADRTSALTAVGRLAWARSSADPAAARAGSRKPWRDIPRGPRRREAALGPRRVAAHTSSAARPVRRTACWARLGGEDYHAFEAPPDPWHTGSGVNAVAA